VRVLWLGGSNDDFGPIPEEQRGFAIAREILESESGEAVTLVRKHIWPTKALPALVERWLRETNPDVVYLKANTYWICYESVAAKAGRRWGGRGERFVLKGQQALGEDRLTGTFLWRTAQWVGHHTIGTSAFFEPMDVVQTLEAILRTVLREEGTSAVMRGGFPPIGVPAGRARAVADARYEMMHDELGAVCGRLHVPFLQDERYQSDHEVRALKASDLVHPNVAGHARTGALDGRALVDAWRRSAEPAQRRA
jgi:hypothetical protein